MEEKTYSADEVAKILSSAGYKITKRNIYYYAFEKNLFDVSGKGKKCFTDKDLDKLQAILILRERITNPKEKYLENIKELIKKHSLEELIRKYPEPHMVTKSFVTQHIEENYKKITLYYNRILVDINGNITMLNTGASKSIGDRPLTLLNKEYSLDSSFLGLRTEELTDLMGTDVNTLLGGDILKHLYFIINWVEKEATFSTVPLPFEGDIIPVTLFSNIPVIDVQVGNKKLKMIIDTGSDISYLHRWIVSDYHQIGTVKDFYPGLGNFETDIYKIPVKISDSIINIRCGELLKELELALIMANADGILGNDLFNLFGSIYFDLQRGIIMGEKRRI